MVSGVSYQIKRAYAATGHGYDDSPQCTGWELCGIVPRRIEKHRRQQLLSQLHYSKLSNSPEARGRYEAEGADK